MKSTCDPEATLRQNAAEIVAKLKTAQAVVTQAEQANAAELQRLDRLAEDIATLEVKLNAESLAEVSDLQARKIQLTALTTKVASESSQRTAEAKAKAGALLGEADVPGFFRAAHGIHKKRLIQLLTPEFHPEQARSLEYIVNNFPSSERLRWWCTAEAQSLPPSALAERLQRFVDGSVPLWRI